MYIYILPINTDRKKIHAKIIKRWCLPLKEIYAKQYTEIGLKIAYYRKLNGFTQEQLAEAINKSWSFIAQLEGVKTITGISLDTLFDISVALNVPPYKFLIFEETL